jgi:hypothetical protein
MSYSTYAEVRARLIRRLARQIAVAPHKRGVPCTRPEYCGVCAAKQSAALHKLNRSKMISHPVEFSTRPLKSVGCRLPHWDVATAPTNKWPWRRARP